MLEHHRKVSVGEQGNSNSNCLLLQPPHRSFSLLPQPSLFTTDKISPTPLWAELGTGALGWAPSSPGSSPLADSCLL